MSEGQHIVGGPVNLGPLPTEPPPPPPLTVGRDKREVTIHFDRPQGGIMRSMLAPAKEHPMACGASLPPLVGDHDHVCHEPVRRPEQSLGIPLHRCFTCGCSWTDAKEAARAQG